MVVGFGFDFFFLRCFLIVRFGCMVSLGVVFGLLCLRMFYVFRVVFCACFWGCLG